LISRIHGTLLARELDRVEVMTPGGVGYDIAIPRTVYERLPRQGEEVTLHTYQLVREDALLLYGFLDDFERLVFARLLGATGVGPKLALSLLSALPAGRLVRAIRERDLASLTAVAGVGRKTAERLAVELASRFDDIAIPPSPPPPASPTRPGWRRRAAPSPSSASPSRRPSAPSARCSRRRAAWTRRN
jgi:holliday junction DNA helicase RuvA